MVTWKGLENDLLIMRICLLSELPRSLFHVQLGSDLNMIESLYVAVTICATLMALT